MVNGFLLSPLRLDGAVLWISVDEFEGSDLGPRVVVTLGRESALDSIANSACVLLTMPPKVIGSLPEQVRCQVFNFVECNLPALLAHWNGEVSTDELFAELGRTA